MRSPSENSQRRGLDPLAKNRMQAAPRHDVGFAPKDSGGHLFYLHQLEKPEGSLGVIKEQIDIGISAGGAPSGRAEQVKMLNAQPLQLGFVPLEQFDGFTAFHKSSRR